MEIDPYQTNVNRLEFSVEVVRGRSHLGRTRFEINLKHFPFMEALPAEHDLFPSGTEATKKAVTAENRKRLIENMASQLAAKLFAVMEANDPVRGFYPIPCPTCQPNARTLGDIEDVCGAGPVEDVEEFMNRKVCGRCMGRMVVWEGYQR